MACILLLLLRQCIGRRFPCEKARCIFGRYIIIIIIIFLRKWFIYMAGTVFCFSAHFFSLFFFFFQNRYTVHDTRFTSGPDAAGGVLLLLVYCCPRKRFRRYIVWITIYIISTVVVNFIRKSKNRRWDLPVKTLENTLNWTRSPGHTHTHTYRKGRRKKREEYRKNHQRLQCWRIQYLPIWYFRKKLQFWWPYFKFFGVMNRMFPSWFTFGSFVSLE